MGTPALVQKAAARSGVYRLLARLWLREVDADLLHELRSPPLRDSWVDAGGCPPKGEGEEIVEELAIEYCRLFVGPKDHLPPFQSVWTSGQFGDATIASMEQYLGVVRYDRQALPAGVMLDHLGVQLEVMAHLLTLYANLDCGGDNLNKGDLQEITQLATTYFAAHLSWPAELLDAAEKRAESEFYASMAALTKRFLSSEV